MFCIRWLRDKVVWLVVYRFRLREWAIEQSGNADVIAHAMISAWLYPRRYCFHQCRGTGTMTLPCRSSLALSLPTISCSSWGFNQVPPSYLRVCRSRAATPRYMNRDRQQANAGGACRQVTQVLFSSTLPKTGAPQTLQMEPSIHWICLKQARQRCTGVRLRRYIPQDTQVRGYTTSRKVSQIHLALLLVMNELRI